jgi:hypothetical protein
MDFGDVFIFCPLVYFVLGLFKMICYEEKLKTS